MKLVDKISLFTPANPFFTFEFFPPRTDQGFQKLIARITRLSRLNPLAVSVTWGAGGATINRSLDLAWATQREQRLETILHLTCTNMVQGLIDDVLKNAKECGIQNILALRGDPPRGEEYWKPTDARFQHAADLVSYIRSSPLYSDYFCIGVAAYPEGHSDKLLEEDEELAYLKQKVDAGADYIMTQHFYDVDAFLEWVKKVRQKGIRVPIIPGIMPIQTYSSFLRLTKLCGTEAPPHVMDALEPIKHDDQRVKDFGVALAVEMIRKINASSEISGFHFCTLNLERSIVLILEQLGWTGEHASTTNRLITGASQVEVEDSSLNSNFRITPSEALDTAASTLAGKSSRGLAQEVGKGELNSEATWDEFPNGRFGDAKSPAFGIGQDPWNPSSSVLTGPDREWGSPKSTEDLTHLFLQYLHSEISSTPFSSNPLSLETKKILPQLVALNGAARWTVGSQPAVDSALSTDEVVGWGPPGGYVFQKSFVEFFTTHDDLLEIVSKLEKIDGDWFTFYAADSEDNFTSNVDAQARNAVTWGIFPGHEVTQSTIIDKESFISWKEEAFEIWHQWALTYPPDCPERRILDEVWRTRWLVTIIHHDFKTPDGLWKLLLDNRDSNETEDPNRVTK
ncbi:methylenetetrahydrofolate reduct [Sistotremastrum suecicum HHB10207 ss-3]|uniref:Methylenetetrahydrofolate reduct n=1 Tax=Sistotremastrum suecicum HHB10207 ss-3 TaxID=1314776 RepID=A0A166E646_9AGAM|nr:methylenetetrahydrofolate reduct [Sistotremastrum suecicum HHB10207 ss-3]